MQFNKQKNNNVVEATVFPKKKKMIEVLTDVIHKPSLGSESPLNYLS